MIYVTDHCAEYFKKENDKPGPDVDLTGRRMPLCFKTDCKFNELFQSCSQTGYCKNLNKIEKEESENQ